MIDKSQRSLTELLADGIVLTHEKNTPILISWTEEIEPIDMFHFYQLEDGIERAFWRDDDHMSIGYSGVCESFEADSHDLEAIERAWHKRLDLSVQSNAKEKGTGPLLFGGMSYHKNAKRDAFWTDFPTVRFVLPSLMVSSKSGRAWVTMNRIIAKEEDVKQVLQFYSKVRKKLRSITPLGANLAEITWNPETDQHIDAWKNAISSLTSEMKEGLLQKVVLARRKILRANQTVDPTMVLKQLDSNHPQGYIFALNYGESTFLGATPEQLVRKMGNSLESSSVAGTIQRGHTTKEDDRLGEELLQDAKNRSEHDFVVESIAQMFNEFCLDVSVQKTPSLLKAGKVQHLHTPVKGITKEGVSLFDMISRLHPTPAMGGKPRSVAVEKIAHHETFDRGWYAAPIGWIDQEGDGEFAVAIRSGVLQGKTASLYAGCGIVEASDPASEVEETELKFAPMLHALKGETHA
ncbi:isochorismate synthase [Aureibacillus halotolerans]|uniref:isochorismate synthase n=1 Tax=Aureibacillus halotolerans TaxID=1508390 RepID=A0A4R6U3Q7_9BACI|nr:isochorismate synthase [Aureibacillus halotolerans]TDQ40306.1 isochorismate synthase [Aureibacillus halotolerans]